MKTIFTPNTAPAYLEAIQNLAATYPVFTFAGVVVITAIAATYATRQF